MNRECQCSMRTKLAGDGCEVCNPDRTRVDEVLFAVERPGGYEDVHPELLGEDVFRGNEWVRWRVVEKGEVK